MNSPALPRLAPRELDSHKGDYGRVLMIGGSRGMAGAISLAASAALRSGAGLVTVAVPNKSLPTVAAFNRCYTTLGLPEDAAGAFFELVPSRLEKHLAPFTALGCGPGMGTGLGASRIVKHLANSGASSAEDSGDAVSAKPCVFDADALNCLAMLDDWRALVGEKHILTPHPGEWARLSKVDASDREGQQKIAAEIANQSGATILLKGSETVIAGREKFEVSATGNPGMATGGSGDVLTGVITALLAQGLSPFEAAHLAAHVHGVAGNLAADLRGQIGMTAEDILSHLPQAFQSL